MRRAVSPRTTCSALGRALAQAGRLDEAQDHLDQALTGFAELGDLTSQARSHSNLAYVLTQRERHGAGSRPGRWDR
ncbi:tetratricopeptide repeat protein [Streptomyces mirabilis]|uniref:tetratricopeptide repeat protein n=1 Tax=Streptomyces mirabilis TaxID=68239 RepID=UPI00367BE87C